MGSTFSSLNAGLTGLYAAQRLIEISGQNINNQNTVGYTRQRVEQKALGIGSTPSIFAGSVPQGGGVEVTGVRRLGDFFLDTKLRLETGKAASAKQISQAWSGVETSMDELGKMSVSNSLREFYKSWGDVNNSSDNRGARATAIGNAQALVTQISSGYTHINDLWTNGRAELDAHVADLNSALDSINELNAQIRAGKLAGGSSGNVNHLIDERDQLALHVSKLTGATVREGYGIYTKDNAPNPGMIGQTYADGTIEIMLGGNSMVGKNFVNHFVVEGAHDMPGIDSAPREKFDSSVQELKTKKGANALDEKFTHHGLEINKYQAQIQRYGVGDNYTDPKTGTNRVLAAGDPQLGQFYTAFYDMEKIQKGDSLAEARIAGTDRGYTIGDFHPDEGEVRLTWQSGGHLVTVEEGTIGGLMNNLRPAEFPGVSGTVGRGGAWAETGKLFNDVATNIATEVNSIHANNLADGGQNNTKSLLTEKATFHLMDPSKPVDDPNRITALTVEVVRDNYASDTEFDAAVAAQIKALEQANPGKAAISTTVKKDGGDFFKFAATDNKLPPALRLQVAITDPQAIAAGVENDGIYDGSVALKLANAQDNATSSLNEWAKSVVDIGVHSSSAQNNQVLTEQTRAIADQQQKSQASVDMNEEVVNLIAGQHAYAGAARIMSTVNQMLETLVNLGR